MTVKVEWIEWDGPLEPLGHGVEFHLGEPGGRSTLLAFLPGYDWLHGDPDVVSIRVVRKHEACSPETLDSFRSAVEEAVRAGSLRNGPLPGERFFAHFNA